MKVYGLQVAVAPKHSSVHRGTSLWQHRQWVTYFQYLDEEVMNMYVPLLIN